MKKNKGVTMGLALVIGAVLAILILSMADQTSKNSGEMVHFDNMYKTLRLTETAFSRAAGYISIAPTTFSDDDRFSAWQTMPDGVIKASAKLVKMKVDDNPAHDIDAYYIVTSATRTISGKIYSADLHTYARISNIGEYFAAVRNDLKLSQGIDAAEGKVYASRLDFDMLDPKILAAASPDDSTKTRVKSAEYYESVTPELPINRNDTNDVYYTNGRLFKRSVIINKNKENLPQKLNSPLLFPQITFAELEFYRGLANSKEKGKEKAHNKCKFDTSTDGSLINEQDSDGNLTGKKIMSVNIFPPGYAGYQQDPLDKYDKHTAFNEDHVYFCDDNMFIQGTIHGQVLFVATKNIYITGNLFVSNDTNFPGNSNDPTINKNSSTANQAILITQNDVWINKFPEISAWNPDPKSLDFSTVTIQAMILAPNGKFDADRYDNQVVLNHLALNFTGSTVLSKGPSFAQTFMAKRTYKYMTSLRDSPPPYLPALVDVYHSIEKTIASGDPVK